MIVDVIELNGVSYSYADVCALDNINLCIAKGEAIALMGANGSGKSTLLKILNGIIFPANGHYLFDGEDITEKRLKDIKFSKRFHQRVGFVFQNSDAQLFCPTVYDEIAFGPKQMGLSESEVSDRVEDCLHLLEIDNFRNRIPYHLSGGEKRKVALACVLSMNPDVLVLDEPMNGLDPKTQKWLVDFLHTIHSAGKTLITSTHNLELVHELSERAILFDESHKIVSDQSTKKLLLDSVLLKEVNLIG